MTTHGFEPLRRLDCLASPGRWAGGRHGSRHNARLSCYPVLLLPCPARLSGLLSCYPVFLLPCPARLSGRAARRTRAWRDTAYLLSVYLAHCCTAMYLRIPNNMERLAVASPRGGGGKRGSLHPQPPTGPPLRSVQIRGDFRLRKKWG